MSVVGERFADLIQREVVARTDLVDCRYPLRRPGPCCGPPRCPPSGSRSATSPIAHDAGWRSAQQDFRAAVAEAILAAVQRIFLPVELDPPTGSFRLPDTMLQAY